MLTRRQARAGRRRDRARPRPSPSRRFTLRGPAAVADARSRSSGRRAPARRRSSRRSPACAGRARAASSSTATCSSTRAAGACLASRAAPDRLRPAGRAPLPAPDRRARTSATASSGERRGGSTPLREAVAILEIEPPARALPRDALGRRAPARRARARARRRGRGCCCSTSRSPRSTSALKGRILPYLLRVRDDAAHPVPLRHAQRRRGPRLAEEAVVLREGAVVFAGAPEQALAWISQGDPEARFDNILAGSLEAPFHKGVSRGTGVLRVGEARLVVPTEDVDPASSLAVFAVSPEDVLVSSRPLVGISARNVLPGAVVALEIGEASGWARIRAHGHRVERARHQGGGAGARARLPDGPPGSPSRRTPSGGSAETLVPRILRLIRRPLRADDGLSTVWPHVRRSPKMPAIVPALVGVLALTVGDGGIVRLRSPAAASARSAPAPSRARAPSTASSISGRASGRSTRRARWRARTGSAVSSEGARFARSGPARAASRAPA